MTIPEPMNDAKKKDGEAGYAFAIVGYIVLTRKLRGNRR